MVPRRGRLASRYLLAHLPAMIEPTPFAVGATPTLRWRRLPNNPAHSIELDNSDVRESFEVPTLRCGQVIHMLSPDPSHPPMAREVIDQFDANHVKVFMTATEEGGLTFQVDQPARRAIVGQEIELTQYAIKVPTSYDKVGTRLCSPGLDEYYLLTRRQTHPHEFKPLYMWTAQDYIAVPSGGCSTTARREWANQRRRLRLDREREEEYSIH